MMNIKNHPIFVTASILTAIYGVVAGIYIHLDGKADNLQEKRIGDYVSQIQSLEKYKDMYAEGVKSKEILSNCLTRYEILKTEYTDFLEHNWQDKYEAERIKTIGLTEQLNLAEIRCKASLANLSQGKKDLLSQLNEIKAKSNSGHSDKENVEKRNQLKKISFLENEIENKDTVISKSKAELRSCEIQRRELNQLLQGKGSSQNKNNVQLVLKVKSSIKGVTSDSSAAKIIIKIITSSGVKISGKDLYEYLLSLGNFH